MFFVFWTSRGGAVWKLGIGARLTSLKFGARFCLACAILTALFYAAGPWYVKTLLPVFQWELKAVHPGV